MTVRIYDKRTGYFIGVVTIDRNELREIEKNFIVK